MDIDTNYPAIADLRRRAKRRIPHFAWEYLDSATGDEKAMARNRQALDDVLLDPAILTGEVEADLTTEFLGHRYAAPFGIAPVGMSGLMWPGAEVTLAALGAVKNIPYCMSNVATQTPETVAPHLGQNGWFQLYAPRDVNIRRDMLKRIKDAGFHTLVLTVDVPVAARRERQRRGGLSHPPTLNARILAQIAKCPTWALGTLKHGMPRLRFIESYADHSGPLPSTEHIGYLMRTAPDWDYLHALRQDWDGPLIVKGVLLPEDAERLITSGVNAIWVSNHAGRQFDAVMPVIDALRSIRAALGPKVPILCDGSIETGLDILRAIACGADFVMLGRAFHFGLGAFGEKGAEHVVSILTRDMVANMGQMGLSRPPQVRTRLRTSA